MPGEHNFEHLPLLLRYQGSTHIPGFREQSPQTRANKDARQGHSSSLRSAARSLSAKWQERKTQREGQDLPTIPPGIPILVQVDPNLELDDLRHHFAFEIVAEQEEGYVIVEKWDGARFRISGEYFFCDSRHTPLFLGGAILRKPRSAVGDHLLIPLTRPHRSRYPLRFGPYGPLL